MTNLINVNTKVYTVEELKNIHINMLDIDNSVYNTLRACDMLNIYSILQGTKDYVINENSTNKVDTFIKQVKSKFLF